MHGDIFFLEYFFITRKFDREAFISLRRQRNLEIMIIEFPLAIKRIETGSSQQGTRVEGFIRKI